MELQDRLLGPSSLEVGDRVPDEQLDAVRIDLAGEGEVLPGLLRLPLTEQGESVALVGHGAIG